MKVSIVVPVYNAEAYIAEMLKSILNQTYQDYEVVLVDDKSTDRSVEIIQGIADSRIKLFHNKENSGIAYTRNKAIELANGDYIALMDDDDIAPPYRIEKEVHFLDENVDIDIVGGHCRFIDEDGKMIPNKQWNVFQNPNYIKAYLLLDDAIPNGSAMIRRKFIESHTLRYQDHMCGAEDYRFWVESSLVGKIANIDEILLYWRIGHNNESKRVHESKTVERNQVLKDIRKYAFEKNGIHLESKQLEILNQIFNEDSIIKDMDEMKLLYEALKNISNQAQQKHLHNAKEITAMCRKRFGEKVGKAMFLWNS